MTLFARAARDSQRILENPRGTGHPVLLRAPDGRELTISTTTNDISSVIDPDTGQIFTGRSVQVYFSLQTLRDNEFEIPRNVPETSGTPWLVIYTGVDGREYRFKVSNGEPDRTLDYVRCSLEYFE